ncbi:hypothetical protein LE181_15045 [Streptomyces sp. SCA3-4]|uniref:hypothetical protein n=1 Tax=Streptomyces sichuanensis TaxID=2871810 RepID=UPI001CE3987C|nr:hypothetical protein [Streptomyces sichuanensis]MCA6093471.1 hypothetical protein [Streptomyces sichuanensis]
MTEYRRRLAEQDVARRAFADAHLDELTALFCDRVLAEHDEHEQQRLGRLMCTPPQPRTPRARHTAGGRP